MLLRKAEKEEFPTVQTFYWDLIDQMEGQKDTVGWKKGIYPTDEFLKESIDNGELYVIDGSEGIIASVIVNSSWNEGYEGITWGIACPREEILVPHALGVSAKEQRRGIGKAVVKDILRMARISGKKAVRLDLLSGNEAAEKLYLSRGFRFVAEKTMYYADTGWTKYRMYEYLLEADDQAAGRDLFWKGCPGPLPDGSCRTPEETCNNPSCSARG